MASVVAPRRPALAPIPRAAGRGFRAVYGVALTPGILAVAFCAILSRDPRHQGAQPVSLRVPMPPAFWRLIAPVGVFGLGNFATAFFALRAAQMLQPELSPTAALSAAVGFYLAHNAVGAAVSFPAGWLADRVGKAPVLASAYATFAVACVVGIFGHGWLAVALLALFFGAQNPVGSSVGSSLTSSIVEERRLGTGLGVLNTVNGVGG